MNETATSEHPDTFAYAYRCGLCETIVEVPEVSDHMRAHKAARDWPGVMSFTRVEKRQRGPIIDYLGALESGGALCKCVHGKAWPEGDEFDDIELGGLACRECVLEFMGEQEHAT